MGGRERREVNSLKWKSLAKIQRIRDEKRKLRNKQDDVASTSTINLLDSILATVTHHYC